MRLVVERMIYMFQVLYRLWRHNDNIIDTTRWIEFFLGKCYCLVGHQRGSSETSINEEVGNFFLGVDREAILMSDRKEWTTIEFLQSIKVAVRETEQSWSRSDDNVIKVQTEDHNVEEAKPELQERLLKVNHTSEPKEDQ